MNRYWIIAPTLLALLIRLVFVWMGRHKGFHWGDEWVYDEIARNLVEHGYFGYYNGAVTLFRPPLYPALIAASYMLFGHERLPILLLQAVLGSMSVALTVMLGYRLTGSRRVGFLAGLILALLPHQIYMTGVFYMETPYLFLLLLHTYLWLQMIAADSDTAKLRYALLSGLVFGVSLLMRPTLFLFPLALALCALVSTPHRKIRSLIPVLISTLCAFAVVAPWTVRNYVVGKGFVLVSSNGGLNLYQGNNDRVNGGALDLDQQVKFPGLSDVEAERAYRKIAVQWIRQHPARFLELVPMKLRKFFAPLETGNRGTIPSRFTVVLNALFLIFYLAALIGFVLTLPRWRAWLMIYLLMLYPILLAAVTYGNTRFAMVIHPFLCLLAAVFLVRLTRGKDKNDAVRDGSR